MRQLHAGPERHVHEVQHLWIDERMQLREYLPFDMRDLMRLLPEDGRVRHKFRQFSLNPRVEGRARSVKGFAEDLGFAVVECNLTQGINGRLVTDTWSERGYCIEVNRAASVGAKRFTVLHEIGHYYLHSDHEDPLSWTEHFDPSGQTFYIDKKAEREANEFAEALLFGSGQLAAAHSLLGGDVQKLARYFGVTEPVVRIAIEKLR